MWECYANKDQKNVDHSLHCIELAYKLGIPTIRVNTGRWGTTKNFDTLMENKGIEPRLEGYTDEEAFKWVIDGFEKCLKKAEQNGVILGLENRKFGDRPIIIGVFTCLVKTGIP